MREMPTMEQIVATLCEVRWSVAFDQLHHESLTEHGRWVLMNAPDVLHSLASPAPPRAPTETRND